MPSDVRRPLRDIRSLAALLLVLSSAPLRAARAADMPPPVTLSGGWRMQSADKVMQTGAEVSSPSFSWARWYKATVPGTALTTLVDNGVYPEPLYGENNRPDKIPDTLCRHAYWYRTDLRVPASYAGRRVWLNFDGVNYAAEVWVNGRKAGAIKGAFTRGVFDITGLVTAGKAATLAVLVSPQPHPGEPHEHTVGHGMGRNGGITAIDGPTFLCAIGWDWIPAIRDRDTGIWQKVFLSSTGPVVIKDPTVTTDLPDLPKRDSATVAVQTTLENVSDQARRGVLKGSFGDVSFTLPVQMAPHTSRLISLDPKHVPQLHLTNPRLWWPNGYGPQNLYTLHLAFVPGSGGAPSDSSDTVFGIRKITYSVPDSDNLTLSVNGVRVFCKGGDWGMDEAMKRIPRARLEAQIRMHRDANYTMIRNWVGQSTSADFYDLCDKYGIMLWDEFFQPNPGDGPNPTDLDTYVANVREKVLRFRSHPSIAVWCARNEGYPPPEIDAALRKILAELDPTRRYQPSSTDGQGVHSGGPYFWRRPRDFYAFNEPFKTEIGSVSIPTLESIQGMMPRKDWETINDDWAEHDLASGAQHGDTYKNMLDGRYGKVRNLADFARKGQMANYEAFRAMYEGRNAKLFAPCTGVITWMSNPAQPSFVWQLYHHDLEPNSSLFAVRRACEPVHVQLNESSGQAEVINTRPEPLENAHVHLTIYNLDGSRAYQHDFAVASAAPYQATDLGVVDWPASLSSVHFVTLELSDASGRRISDNFYWRALPDHPDDLTPLNSLPTATLTATVVRRDAGDNCLLSVTLRNPGPQVALMAHLQLRRARSGERVLPVFYSDNYLSFAPGETKTVTIEAARSELKGETPLIMVDGWNIGVKPAPFIALNTEAQVAHWPVTGLPLYLGPPQDHYRIHCGGEALGGFSADDHYAGGNMGTTQDVVDTGGVAQAGPPALYRTERWDSCVYTLPMKPLPRGKGYTVLLHFAETTFDAAGKRVFSVDINGKPVLTDFDIFKEAGGKDKLILRRFTDISPDQDGNILIRLRRGPEDRPEIRAIEVLPP